MEKLLIFSLTLFLLILIQSVNSQIGRPINIGRTALDGNKTSIKCYQCNSFYDKGCADFFDNITYPLKPCPPDTHLCRKIIQETYYEGRWDVRYIRQCAKQGDVGPDEGRWCQERMGTFRVKVKYCHCDNKDGCNSASSVTLNYWTLTALPILTYLLCRFRLPFRPPHR